MVAITGMTSHDKLIEFQEILKEKKIKFEPEINPQNRKLDNESVLDRQMMFEHNSERLSYML